MHGEDTTAKVHAGIREFHPTGSPHRFVDCGDQEALALKREVHT